MITSMLLLGGSATALLTTVLWGRWSLDRWDRATLEVARTEPPAAGTVPVGTGCAVRSATEPEARAS